MKRSFFGLKSFRLKITAIIILLMCLAGATNNLLIYDYSIKSQLNQLRDKLMIIAKAAAMTIDPETISLVPLNEDGRLSQPYKTLEIKLLRIKELSPTLAYIYILKKTEKENMLQFVVDAHPGDYYTKIAPATPGEEYNAAAYPELLEAFTRPSADKNIVPDKWGMFLSGYAPIVDKAGKTVAVMGIDMAADDVYSSGKEIDRRALLILLVGVLVSVIVGFIIAGRIAQPINKLLEGTRNISSGNLQHKVVVKGSDEIKELADSFNKMSSNLYKARTILLNYFYRAAQSLIRILEARDAYTKGHSDRVAEFSEKIAESIGISKDRMETLHNAALLHDIGKLGIHEMILSKKTTLTNEDWHAVRKHPEIGEEILKPVSLDNELLAVVREHHERYDGKGYPDGLAGDQIDILASIVAVADSYDAMVSDRSYKKNLTKEEAIEQLRANIGLQFDPKIVKAFIKILEEGKA